MFTYVYVFACMLFSLFACMHVPHRICGDGRAPSDHGCLYRHFCFQEVGSLAEAFDHAYDPRMLVGFCRRKKKMTARDMRGFDSPPGTFTTSSSIWWISLLHVADKLEKRRIHWLSLNDHFCAPLLLWHVLKNMCTVVLGTQIIAEKEQGAPPKLGANPWKHLSEETCPSEAVFPKRSYRRTSKRSSQRFSCGFLKIWNDCAPLVLAPPLP